MFVGKRMKIARKIEFLLIVRNHYRILISGDYLGHVWEGMASGEWTGASDLMFPITRSFVTKEKAATYLANICRREK
jgi:hypothetical protein